MKYFIFDTETTDMWASGEVIQFAGVLTDENFNVLTLVNFYCDTLQEISKGAMDLHHITKEELHLRSDGKFFEEYWTNDYKWLFEEKDIIWIGWNVQFDIRMVNNTLGNNGYPPMSFGDRVYSLSATEGVHYFDLMPAATAFFGISGGKFKLSNALARCDYTSAKADAVYNRIYELFKPKQEIIEQDRNLHRADYDAIATWIILNHLGNRLR